VYSNSYAIGALTHNRTHICMYIFAYIPHRLTFQKEHAGSDSTVLARSLSHHEGAAARDSHMPRELQHEGGGRGSGRHTQCSPPFGTLAGEVDSDAEDVTAGVAHISAGLACPLDSGVLGVGKLAFAFWSVAASSRRVVHVSQEPFVASAGALAAAGAVAGAKRVSRSLRARLTRSGASRVSFTRSTSSDQ
jgi:hypothetical protein